MDSGYEMRSQLRQRGGTGRLSLQKEESDLTAVGGLISWGQLLRISRKEKKKEKKRVGRLREERF